jgi:hypothetical protein
MRTKVDEVRAAESGLDENRPNSRFDDRDRKPIGSAEYGNRARNQKWHLDRGSKFLASVVYWKLTVALKGNPLLGKLETQAGFVTKLEKTWAQFTPYSKRGFRNGHPIGTVAWIDPTLALGIPPGWREHHPPYAVSQQ